jgi:hypothetical protein
VKWTKCDPPPLEETGERDKEKLLARGFWPHERCGDEELELLGETVGIGQRSFVIES